MYDILLPATIPSPLRPRTHSVRGFFAVFGVCCPPRGMTFILIPRASRPRWQELHLQNSYKMVTIYLFLQNPNEFRRYIP